MDVLDDPEIHYRRAIALLEVTLGSLTQRDIAIIREHSDARGYADWVAHVFVRVVNREAERGGTVLHRLRKPLVP